MSSTLMKNNETAICVLAKYPIEGNVKTRLAKKIDSFAVSLYEDLLINTIDQVCKLNTPNDVFVVSSDNQHAELLKLFLPTGIRINFYQENKLGNLLMRIFENLLVDYGYKKVIITCSDSPFITPSLLLNACDLLDESGTLFISPSSDGGYSVVGLNKFVDIFSPVTMSTGNVLEHTIELAKTARLRICTSEVIDDIDTDEDIRRLFPLLNDTYDPTGSIRKRLTGIINTLFI